MFVLDVFQDAFFAALAAIGFSSISNPPKQAYKYCAFIAAMGHATRFILMNSSLHWGLINASFIASVVIGCLAVLLSSYAKCPPETFSFPSLLPMIPGIYAYHTIEGLVFCLSAEILYRLNHFFLSSEKEYADCRSDS